MEIKVFSESNWTDYESWFQNYESNFDIYYHPSFLASEAELLDGKAFVFLAVNHDGNYFLYPFIKRPIPLREFGLFYDITSPYGYCGPIIGKKDSNFFEVAEKELCF